MVNPALISSLSPLVPFPTQMIADKQNFSMGSIAALPANTVFILERTLRTFLMPFPDAIPLTASQPKKYHDKKVLIRMLHEYVLVHLSSVSMLCELDMIPYVSGI